MEKLDIAVIVGSLRKDSFSRKVALALIDRAPQEVSARVVEIGALSVYNQDLDDKPPPGWKRFRDQLGACQAVLFVTPEYNRSIPGCLKNAIDIASRPEGENIWAGMPAGVVSVTPYKLGAFGANHALRQTFVFLDMPALQQPEVYIGGVADLFDSKGNVKNKDTDTLLRNFMETFTDFALRNAQAESSDFDAFLQDRKKAAAAYVRGDAGPLDTMVTEQNPASFFHPNGPTVQGAAAVRKRYDADAKAFGPDGRSTLEIIQSGSNGTLGFWTGIQRATATIKGKRVPMALRITEVFRFEDGWKLVHRHAESIKT